jgi:quinol monooxygenase YgiN
MTTTITAAQPADSPFAMLVTFRVKPDSRSAFRQALLTDLEAHFAQPYTKAVLTLSEQALESPMAIRYLSDLAPLSGAAHRHPANPQEAVDLVVVFSIKPGRRDQFIRQFEKSVRFSRPEAGCVAFHIHVVADEPDTFVLYERWQNQAAFDFHLAQSYTNELFASFDQTLAVPVAQRLQYIVDQAPVSATGK